MPPQAICSIVITLERTKVQIENTIQILVIVTDCPNVAKRNFL
jgi:hypothetical protein